MVLVCFETHKIQSNLDWNSVDSKNSDFCLVNCYKNECCHDTGTCEDKYDKIYGKHHWSQCSS